MKLPGKLKIEIEVKNANEAEKNDYLLALKINEIIDYLAEREVQHTQSLAGTTSVPNLPVEVTNVGTPLFKAESKRLQPVYGDRYWFITDHGAVKSNTETGESRDKWRYKMGNYYTEEQAREALLRLTTNHE